MTGDSPGLRPELTALVHHVELNEAGWWDKGLQHLIVSMIWLSEESPTIADVVARLETECSLKVDSDRVGSQLKELMEQGSVIRTAQDRLKISEENAKSFAASLEEAMQSEAKARRRFQQLLEEYCPTLEPEKTWSSFVNECLAPLVREMGAKTYAMITGSAPQMENIAALSRYVEGHPEALRPTLRKTIVRFLDPSDADVRSYVLRQLNACFFLEASSLQKDTIDGIARLMATPPRIRIFVDTNFLISIFGLRGNPSNEAANSLMSLISSLANVIQVDLHLAPVTAEETQSALIGMQGEYGDIRIGKDLVTATSELDLPGLIPLMEAAGDTDEPLTFREFLDPYVSNVADVAKTKGVSIYNTKMESYRTRSDVVDDINEQLEMESGRKSDRKKGYAQVEHDMVLWHFVRDLRPAYYDSLLDAQFWIVTLDFRFLAFDRQKAKAHTKSTPLCAHPAALIQMLQLWVPRTPDFEKAVMSNLRLPFLLHEFDADAERVAVRILTALSRFENLGDLPDETITALLINKTLRQKLLGEHSVERQIELVREAIIDEVNATRQQLKRSAAKLSEIEAGRQQLREEIRGQKVRVHAAEKRADAAESEAATATAAATKAQELLAETALSQREHRETSSRRTRFAIVWVTAPVLLAFAVAGAGLIPLTVWAGSPWWSWAAMSSPALLLWLFIVDRRASDDSALSTWRPVQVLHEFRGRLFTFGLAVAASIIGAAIWELFF